MLSGAQLNKLYHLQSNSCGSVFTTVDTAVFKLSDEFIGQSRYDCDFPPYGNLYQENNRKLELMTNRDLGNLDAVPVEVEMTKSLKG